MEVPAWTPSIVLDGAPFLSDASIKDFQQGKVGYIANTVEQALLLPSDMVDLRSMRKHEVFLNLKRDLAMVSPSPNPYFFSFFIIYFFYIQTLQPSSLFFHLFFYIIFLNYASFLGRLFRPHIGPRRW